MRVESISTAEPHRSTRGSRSIHKNVKGGSKSKRFSLDLQKPPTLGLPVDDEDAESAPSLSEQCSETESTSSDGERGANLSPQRMITLPDGSIVNLDDIERNLAQERNKKYFVYEGVSLHSITKGDEDPWEEEWPEIPAIENSKTDANNQEEAAFQKPVESEAHSASTNSRKSSKHQSPTIKASAIVSIPKGYLIPKPEKDSKGKQRKLPGKRHCMVDSPSAPIIASGRRALTSRNPFARRGRRRVSMKSMKERMYRSEAFTVPEDKAVSTMFPGFTNRRQNSLYLLPPPEVLRTFTLSAEGEDIDVWNDTIEELKHKLSKVRSKRVEKAARVEKKAKRKGSENKMRKQQSVRLEDSVLNLEAKINIYRSELDERIELSDKMASDHLLDMTEAQQIYRKMRRHSSTITMDRLSTGHDREINRFETKLRLAQARDQRLQKRYEVATEVLRNQLKATEEARDRTLSQMARQVLPSRSHHFRMTPRLLHLFTVVSTFIVVYFGSQESLKQGVDFLCSPARPGTYLTVSSGDSGSFEAPWWVPSYSATKANVFAAVCGARQRSKLTWLPATKKGRGVLKLFKLTDSPAVGVTTASLKPAWTRHIAVSADMRYDHVKITHQTGNIERLATLN